MTRPPEAALAALASRAVGEPVEVRDLRRLAGGASRETWSFDAALDDGSRRGLVLRRDPSGHVGQTERSTEYAVIRAAAAAGVAAPTVLGLLEPGDGLGAGFLMDRIDGETIPRHILRDPEYAQARERLAGQAGEQAACIHAVDVAVLPDLPVLGARDQIHRYRELLDALDSAHPAFELGLRWLAEHAPPEQAPARLVHGDFRNGNLVVGPDGLRGVLDWELAHLGDPIEDLGWMCVRSWRFGSALRAGGLGTVDKLVEGYRSGGGTDVDPAHLRYWEVFGTLKWGVICRLQALTHQLGTVRSVELAALGRRVCEMEWDLVDLIA